MYLAPLNYDRYFKKVFSDLKIAKRFLEDFLDVEIQQIEHLERKKSISDDAQFVEFDFRCQIENSHVIIEMQQWYKPDIVQRFYLYHALNTALQLETLPTKNIVLPEKGLSEVKDYRRVLPVITLVWLVDDTLGFEDDFVSFIPMPEQTLHFIQDVRLWQNPDVQKLIKKRDRIFEQVKNNTKGLDWLYENKLIYAFQKNIVRNKKFEKYYAWFELAQKTLDKISDKFAYSEYEKDDILSEIIRRLKKEVESPKQIKYIQDYDKYREGILRYEGHIRNDTRKQVEAELLPQIEKINKEIKNKDKAIEEKEKTLQKEREKTIRLLRELGMSDEQISDKTGFSIEIIKNLS